MKKKTNSFILFLARIFFHLCFDFLPINFFLCQELIAHPVVETFLKMLRIFFKLKFYLNKQKLVSNLNLKELSDLKIISLTSIYVNITVFYVKNIFW